MYPGVSLSEYARLAGVAKSNRYPCGVKETAPDDQHQTENDFGKGANAGRDTDGGDGKKQRCHKRNVRPGGKGYLGAAGGKVRN